MNCDEDESYSKKDGRGRPRILPLKEVEKWKEEYGEQFSDPKTIKFVQSLLQKELIKSSEIVAAHLLYDSCISRVNACKYNIGIYRNISCDWNNPDLMLLDIIMKKQEMWREWVNQSFYYDESGEQSDRPSIDRIQEKGNYTLDNIQMLSIKDNVARATAKPHYVFDITDLHSVSNSKQPKYKKYESKQDALASLGIKFTGDTGRLYESKGRMYLVQSEQVTFGEKEIEQYEDEDESKCFEGRIAVGLVEDDKGNKFALTLPFIFPQMKIVLKHKDVS